MNKRIILFAVLLNLAYCSFSLCQDGTYKYPYLNPNLSTEQRVNDLVGRMTLDEKISQMMNAADSIPRLGIPSYDWWSEGLHGVARAGIATVFPQAIGLAATWDDKLLQDVADIISTEFRAKFNQFQREGDRAIYKGLTVWSPNINIFRDPRWGRGQETYGEDPYLTSRMGVAFVKGLQGNDPKYFKVIATPKHYAVHSGPEPLRHEFDAVVNYRDFAETYSPAFRSTIVDAKAYSIMGAYQRYLGVPCNASKLLLQDFLRTKWGFKGYVVSDCGAIDDIYLNHKYVKTAAEAGAIAVLAGCDLECGQTYKALDEAVEKNLIKEADLDVAVKRLFTARMKLGLFDPPEMVKYAQIPIEMNDSKEHKEAALKTAKESIVLLKNNGILPLKKDLKKIAVVGPNANSVYVLYGNYNGNASDPVTILKGIKNKAGNTEVIFNRGCGLYDETPPLDLVPEGPLSSRGKQGLTAEYFDNINLEGEPFLTRIDKQINFDFEATPPLKGKKPNDFSVRWTGKIIAPATTDYYFGITGDDGYRFYFNDKLVIDNWTYQSPTLTTTTLHLEEGKTYDIRIEYFQGRGGASITFEWGIKETNQLEKMLTAVSSADAIVFVGGIAPSLEGEEMSVNVDGFSGGDRTSLDLPTIQIKYLKALKETGKPIILVLLNGSALSVNWENENLDAIVEAWYPGQAAGTAVADILFGDYNPAGRLPVTFYKSVDDLPPFEDYNMANRTYRYFKGEPLYPFGYGLSYTTFKYSGLTCTNTAKPGEDLKVSVDVENTGAIDGDEVVQVYIKLKDAKVPVAIHALKEFTRINLKKGEKKNVRFTLHPRQLSLIDDNDRRVVEPGNVEIFVGGSQPNDKLISENKVLKAEVKFVGDVFVVEE